MKINIQLSPLLPPDRARVGHVYPVRGGRGMMLGHMNVLIAIGEPVHNYNGQTAIMLTIDKHGNPVGATNYALSRVEELQPIAFVEGLEDLEFNMRPLL